MFKLTVKSILLLTLFLINTNSFSYIDLNSSNAIIIDKDLTEYIKKNPDSWDTIIYNKYINRDKSIKIIVLEMLGKKTRGNSLDVSNKVYLKYLLKIYTNKDTRGKYSLHEDILSAYLGLKNNSKSDETIIRYLKKIQNFENKNRTDILLLGLMDFEIKSTSKRINKTEYLKKWANASPIEGKDWISLAMEARSGDIRAISLLLKKINDYKSNKTIYLNALDVLKYVPQHKVREYVVINMFDDRNFTTNRLPKKRFSYSRYFAKLLEKIDPNFPIKKTTGTLWLSEIDMESIKKYYVSLINKELYKIPKKEAYFYSFYGVGLSTLFLHNNSSRGFQYFETAIELAPSNKKERLRNSIVKALYENNKEQEASNFIKAVKEKNLEPNTHPE